MKVAALDLGSNTFLCLIAEVSRNRVESTYYDAAQVVRLGQGLEKSKRFHSEALMRADNCLKQFSEAIQRHDVKQILAMATSAARDAENKEDLFSIAKKYGIPIEIIPGEKEAEMTYQGAISGQNENEKNLLVLDIGGGSTEFIFGHGSKLLKGESYDIGCVRLTEKFITQQPTSDLEIENVVQMVDSKILRAKSIMPQGFILDEIIAVAGTPTSLAAAELGQFDANRIDGYSLSVSGLQTWLARLQMSTIEQKIEMGVPEGRADVILIGVIILLRTLQIMGLKQMKVSTRGVRYGVALEMGRRIYSGG